MSEIPARIMEQAREVADLASFAFRANTGGIACDVHVIAQALLAAEKRGKEEERERCFAEADKYTYASGVANRIADAIRGS